MPRNTKRVGDNHAHQSLSRRKPFANRLLGEILYSCLQYAGVCDDSYSGYLNGFCEASGCGIIKIAEAGIGGQISRTLARYLGGSGNASRGLLAEVDADGILNLVIRRGAGTPSGSQMFDEAVEWANSTGGMRGVRGTWNQSKALGDNLASFNAAISSGATLEEAALKTFTGKMASRLGMNNVTFEEIRGLPGAYTNIKVVFTP